MKSIKEHLMFILPLLAVLIAIQLVEYIIELHTHMKKKLRNSYSILVSAKESSYKTSIKKV